MAQDINPLENVFGGFGLGESNSARSGEDKESVEVRESGGKFYTQRLQRSESGKVKNKQTIGRASRNPDRAMGLAMSEADVDQPERSTHAMEVDRAMKAETAPDWETYTEEPNEYDWPGIDTPF